jgi:1,4-dihydroxy-2-naphthoate octaprenyltransferase
MQEPTPQQLAGAPARFLVATRPGFLSASAVPVLIGLSLVSLHGAVNWFTAMATLIGAMIAQAGANVLNDYFDARAGCDQINEDRVFPFTGGSRMIQNEVLSPAAMLRLGLLLTASATLIGLALASLAGPKLLAIGLAGLLVGWAYSAPPLRLSARGFGELSVALAFGLLIPLGTYFVQTGEISPLAMAGGTPYALLIALVLYINQFPDITADAATAKRNWVVRLGARRARFGYPLLVAGAYLSLLLLLVSGLVPASAGLAFLALPLHLHGGRGLMHHAETPAALRPAIEATLRGTMLHGLLFAAGIVLAAVW